MQRGKIYCNIEPQKSILKGYLKFLSCVHERGRGYFSKLILNDSIIAFLESMVIWNYFFNICLCTNQLTFYYLNKTE